MLQTSPSCSIFTSSRSRWEFAPEDTFQRSQRELAAAVVSLQSFLNYASIQTGLQADVVLKALDVFVPVPQVEPEDAAVWELWPVVP